MTVRFIHSILTSLDGKKNITQEIKNCNKFRRKKKRADTEIKFKTMTKLSMRVYVFSTTRADVYIIFFCTPGAQCSF